MQWAKGGVFTIEYSYEKRAEAIVTLKELKASGKDKLILVYQPFDYELES